MSGILSDFMYWLNYNSLFFSVDIIISQKSLFSHTFSWYLSLFSVLKKIKTIEDNEDKKMKTIQAIKITMTLFLLIR